MSEADHEQTVGRAVLEYAEARKELAMYRSEFRNLARALELLAQSAEAEGELERVLKSIRTDPPKLLDELGKHVAEFLEVEARFRASRTALYSLRIPEVTGWFPNP